MSLAAWYDDSMMKLDDFMTTREAAEELGITPAGVRYLILYGKRKVNALKIGNTWLIPASEVEKLRDVKPGRPSKSP